MMYFRFRLGVSFICKMRFETSGIRVVENPTNLRVTPFCNLLREQNFFRCRPLQSAKISLDFGSSRSLSSFSPRSDVAKISLSETNDSPATIRVSRFARTEAQAALFDYLHYTRSLQFTDADYISKNSPSFVHNLLSKVGNDQDIRWTLSKFLRYHPINEFEPFFESLGLKPSEFSSLLPRNLMFLNDDVVLLENFHVLCNYGIPRCKIGKIYEEATEIFRYGYGVLISKLQDYEKLGLGKPTVVALVTCCPTLLIGAVNEVLVRVLEKLKFLGIDYDWIGERLSVKNSYSWSRMFETLSLLSEMGCSKKDFSRLLKKHPEFLFDDSGRKIYVLVVLMMKLGLKMDEILGFLLNYPRIFDGSFSKYLWRAIDFLCHLGMDTEDIARIVRTHPHVLGACTLFKKPRMLLSKMNVRSERLCDIIKEDPMHLTNLATRSRTRLLQVVDDEENISVPKTNFLMKLEKTNFLLKLGYAENSDDLMKALKRFRGRGDQLKNRFDCLVDAGLDTHDVSNMIRAAPPVLNQSREVIEMKLDHLVNHLGYPLSSILQFPTYLCYDIGRIKLRFSMYKWLKDKGAAKPMLSLSTLLACSEARFEKYLVSVHSEGPEVWKKLKCLSPVA